MALCWPWPASPQRRYRWERLTLSSPAPLPCTPPDSGYGSQRSTPAHVQPEHALPEKPSPGFYLDGAVSQDPVGPEEDQDDDLDTPLPIPDHPKRLPEKSATLPRVSARTRPHLPAAFHSYTTTGTHERGIGPARRGLGGGSLRLPDRFVPQRDHSVDVSSAFRTNKLPHELTPSERVLRHEDAAMDPFCYRRRPITPMAADIRQLSRSESAVRRTAHFPTSTGTVLGPLPSRNQGDTERQFSHGTVWAVGGVAPGGMAVDNGRGRLMQSGTNAPLFITSFPAIKARPEEELDKHEGRLASALEMDRVQRVLGFRPAKETGNGRLRLKRSLKHLKTFWNGNEWVKHGPMPKSPKPSQARVLPIAPFKVLDAPSLRDDYYCSVLAYSSTCHSLVVGLGNLLYGWSEPDGVKLLNRGANDGAWLTALAFSSAQGCKCILAFGRSNCQLGLMSLYDSVLPRFEVSQASPVAALSWRPTCTMRPSRSPFNPGVPVKMEDLLVGDEAGHVYYYSVEWPDAWEVSRNNWPGQMTLLARIAVHGQQICGIAWSTNGELFATGGNDNLCCLFEVEKVLEEEGDDDKPSASERGRTESAPPMAISQVASETTPSFDDGSSDRTTRTPVRQARNVKAGSERHKWEHGAAVKAIAFCPWREGLIATGGGSNDKCVHFFHTTSGAALATIAVSAQVTSLIWSTTRREIAATFGYASPEHPYRIAVFSWPDCSQVVAIPWEGEHRALYAIAYPGGPDDARADSTENANGERRRNRTTREGCIVVAASDESVKFHEVWSADKKAVAGGAGMLGGSDILEDLEGIDKDGDIIR